MAILNSSLKRENESWLIKNQTEQGVQDVGEVSYTVSDEGCNFNITKRNGFDEVMSNPTDKAAVQKIKIGYLFGSVIHSDKKITLLK